MHPFTKGCTENTKVAYSDELYTPTPGFSCTFLKKVVTESLILYSQNNNFDTSKKLVEGIKPSSTPTPGFEPGYLAEADCLILSNFESAAIPGYAMSAKCYSFINMRLPGLSNHNNIGLSNPDRKLFPIDPSWEARIIPLDHNRFDNRII